MRIYNSIWKEIKLNENKVKELSISRGLSLTTSRVLLDRLDLLEEKLQKDKIKNIDLAAKKIYENIKLNQKITIFGDYDVDGMSATAIMIKFFNDNSYFNVDYVIPSRDKEGYGLNEKSIYLVKDTDLLITVDCGITSVDEVKALNDRGIKVIVTDHHEPKDKLPDTLLVNPKLGYNFKEISGGFIAYKLCEELNALYGFKLSDDLVVLAMLSTISDLMPLINENREIVIRGLELIEDTNILGLRKLIRYQRLKEVDSINLAFRIIPVLNACGRLNNNSLAMKILLDDNCSDDTVMNAISLNEKRKDIVSNILNDLEFDEKDKSIVVLKGDYPLGVIGLIAQRLAEKHRLPSVVFSQKKELIASSRSIGDFNILKAIDNSKEHIISFGGHKGAAGLKIEIDKYNDFKKSIEEYSFDNLNENDRLNYFNYYKIDIFELERVIEEIDLFKPFGNSNLRPFFRYNNVKILDFSVLGKNKNVIRLNLEIDGRSFEGVSFLKDYPFKVGKYYDIMFYPSINNYTSKINLEIVDIRAKKLDVFNNNILLDYYVELSQKIKTYNTNNNEKRYILLNNMIKYSGVNIEDFKYKGIDKLSSIYLFKDLDINLLEFENKIILSIPTKEDLTNLYKFIKDKSKVELSLFKDILKLFISLNIFKELDIIEYSLNSDKTLFIKIKDVHQKLDLNNSITFNKAMKLKEDFFGFKIKNKGD